MKVTTPSVTEQTRIAEFLDQETAKIDALVAEQERLMALLKEKRQAVISHAVTKGLNPKAALKPSGIEWLGDVPAHWQVIKLGMISTFKGGAGFPDEYQGQTENEIPFFKVGDIVNSDGSGVMRQANHTISRETAKELRAFIFPPATIVFAKVGAALLMKRFRTLGQPSCIDNNMMGVTAGETAKADFLLYVLPLLDFELIVNPGAVPSINEGQISSQRVALPPVGEQKEITAYLDTEIAKLDTLTAEAQRAIDLLQERRTALISAAVTGQIDVRHN
jgi:type I restriction enzyme S subunit